MKRIFIVHGWSGSPHRDWIPWISQELLKRGYEVEALSMPFTFIPLFSLWMPYLKKKVGVIDENTYFIGYSLGTRAILLLLQSQENKAGGAVLVGAFAGGAETITFHMNILFKGVGRLVTHPWVAQKINFSKIIRNSPRLVVVLSDNDSLIPYEANKMIFEKENIPVVTAHNRGHFIYYEIGPKVPEVLEQVLRVLR